MRDSEQIIKNPLPKVTIQQNKKPLLQRVILGLKQNYELYLFLLPAIIVIFIFNYVPMYGIQLAFKDYDPIKGIAGSPWAGFKYFNQFFNSYQFWDLIKNTLGISIYQIIIGFPFPIFLALVFNQIRSKRFKGIVTTVSYMPHFISVVVLVGMLIIFLSPTSGLAANIYKALGLSPINFMGESSMFKSIYVFSDVWQHAGWNSIIYLAALASVDPSLYDAAAVDGASRFQKILHIDIPFLIPTIVILLILSIGSIMGIGFEKAYMMQNSLNISSSEIISTYVYKIGLLSNQYSYSAAIGLFNTIINFVLLFTVNMIANKITETSLW